MGRRTKARCQPVRWRCWAEASTTSIPPEHAELYAEIAGRGCVVSESPPGARAQARDFPRRNRLISGLSLAVVVVEAELRSGSLITARLAVEQGREVLAVPGSPLDPRAKGTNDLIRQGAALCEGADDVLRAIGGMAIHLREPDTRDYGARDYGAIAAEPDAATLDRLRERLAALVSPTPTSRDELTRITGAPAPSVYAALTELTLAGRVEVLAGDWSFRRRGDSAKMLRRPADSSPARYRARRAKSRN